MNTCQLGNVCIIVEKFRNMFAPAEITLYSRRMYADLVHNLIQY